MGGKNKASNGKNMKKLLTLSGLIFTSAFAAVDPFEYITNKSNQLENFFTGNLMVFIALFIVFIGILIAWSDKPVIVKIILRIGIVLSVTLIVISLFLGFIGRFIPT